MRLPNANHVIVAAEKVRDYLLSPWHSVGADKAPAFAAAGYRQDNWWRLQHDLRVLARTSEAEVLNVTLYGRKFLVRGTLKGPTRPLRLITIWILPRGERFPRFVTAYPDTP